MAIYDIFEHAEKQVFSKGDQADFSHHFYAMKQRGEEKAIERHLFSSIAARLFFLMLLFTDLAWGLLNTVLGAFALAGNLCLFFKGRSLKRYGARRWLNIKRSLVCAIALFVALFSPALGTMFACSYFLMYDKQGIDEIVPSVLQDQFKEFLSPS